MRGKQAVALYYTFALLAFCVLLLRIAEFNNPMSGFDEQFYLYMGHAMANGQLPYVDIFDRKPIGLFLIYGVAGQFSSLAVQVMAYHILALLFVCATTFLLFVMARKHADTRLAFAAALAYPIWLNLPGGAGGQSPVFYNLFVTAAAWAIHAHVGAGGQNFGRFVRLGLGVMLLLGCAMQVKYTAVFEGVYFGLFLLWFGIRRFGFVRLVPVAMGWVIAALLPTLLAALYYWHLGYLDEFIFANFSSIAERITPDSLTLLKRLALIFAVLAPLLALSVPGIARVVHRRPFMQPDAQLFLIGWLVSAIAAVLVFGTYYPHYGLAIMPAACAAIALNRVSGRKMQILTAGVLIIAAIGGQIARYEYRAGKGGWTTLATLAKAVGEPANCPFLFDVPPIFHDYGGYCTPTRLVFPAHLNQAVENDAVGIPVLAETRRILLSNPQVIVLRENSFSGANEQTRAIVVKAIVQRYALVGRADAGGSDYLVYRLRPGFTPLPNMVVPALR